MAWANIAIASTVISAVGGIYGQYQSGKAQEKAAEWNADQARKQAKYDEQIAQENMRRKRDDNKRELARRRANNARGGLAETGGVYDSLVETSDRLQTEVDDIWNRAAKNTEYLEGQANMSLWQGKQARTASYINMASTAASGAMDIYKVNKSVQDSKAALGGGQKPI